MLGKRFIAGLLAIGTIGVLFLAADTGFTASSGTLHYPDLRTRKGVLKRDLRIVYESNNKLLKFSNSVKNFGDGPLELRAENSTATETTEAYQRIYSHDDQGNPYLADEVKVGTFAFHPEHNHWHFSDFALYRLHEVTDSGSIGEGIRSGRKTTFCIADSNRLSRKSLEHASLEKAYPASQCDDTNNIQGISVGWADTYGWRLVGQEIDVTGLRDGQYWLVSMADPDNALLETRNSNNKASIKIQISGDTVSVL